MTEKALIRGLLSLGEFFLIQYRETVVVPEEYCIVLHNAAVYLKEAGIETNSIPIVNGRPVCGPNPAPTRSMPPTETPTPAHIQQIHQRTVSKRPTPDWREYESIWDLRTPETKRRKGDWGATNHDDAKNRAKLLREHGITMKTLDLDPKLSPPQDSPLARATYRAEQALGVIIGHNTHDFHVRIRLFAFLSYILVLWQNQLLSDAQISHLFGLLGSQGDIDYQKRILNSVKKYHTEVIGKLYEVDSWSLTQATLIIASEMPFYPSHYHSVANEKKPTTIYHFWQKIGKEWMEEGHPVLFPGDESVVELIQKWEPTLRDGDIRKTLYPPAAGAVRPKTGLHVRDIHESESPIPPGTTGTTPQRSTTGNTSRISPLPSHVADAVRGYGPWATASCTKSTRSVIDKNKLDTILGIGLVTRAASVHVPQEEGLDFKLEIQVPSLAGQKVNQIKGDFRTLKKMLGNVVFEAMMTSKKAKENNILGFVGSCVNVLCSGEKVVVMMGYHRGVELCLLLFRRR